MAFRPFYGASSLAVLQLRGCFMLVEALSPNSDLLGIRSPLKRSSCVPVQEIYFLYLVSSILGVLGNLNWVGQELCCKKNTVASQKCFSCLHTEQRFCCIILIGLHNGTGMGLLEDKYFFLLHYKNQNCFCCLCNYISHSNHYLHGNKNC